MTKAEARVWADDLEGTLRPLGEPARAEHSQGYLKSDLEFFGLRVPVLRKAVKARLRETPDLDHHAVVAIVEALWDSKIFERRAAAVEVLAARPQLLEPVDLPLIERMLRQSKTWALVDGLAIDTVGMLLQRHPAIQRELDRWATDEDFWIRRSALLAHLRPLKRGDGDFETFGRQADTMLEEREFFIRKAIGWVLRDMSRKRPQLVIDWIAPRTARASGVTMREVVRHLPEADRERLMTAYREGRPATP